MRFIYEPEKFFIMVGVRVCAFNNDDRHLFFFSSNHERYMASNHFQVISSELQRQNYMTAESKCE